MMVLYLQEIGFSQTSIGEMFTYTLLGDALISIILTSRADRVGRRVSLLIGSALAIVTTIIFASQTNFSILLISAIFGVISPSGNEIGPFMSIELSSLSQVTDESDRTILLAWYNFFGSLLSALGAMICGNLLTLFQHTLKFNKLESYRYVLLLYGCIQIVSFVLIFMLSPAIEMPKREDAKIKEVNPVNLYLGLHKSKSIVLHLSLLFMIDAFAGTFILQSIISSWFHDTYGTSVKVLGEIVFICNIVAGISALFAARLADYIGLVMTMTVTHLPSNILIILVPLMPNELSAIILLCFRYSISQMDVPTRNAYVQGVVDPDERSAANGITNVVRSIGGSMGPYLAGLLYQQPKFSAFPFFIAGVLKIIYDLLLVYSFISVKPSSEISFTPIVGKEEEDAVLMNNNTDESDDNNMHIEMKELSSQA